MKQRTVLWKVFGFSLLTVAVVAGTQPVLAGSCGGTVKHDIVDTAVEAGSFSTLIAAVKTAGLVDALRGEGPITVFAPTDEAFAKLPSGTVDELLNPENKEMLVAILTYHVASGSLTADEVVNLDRIETLNGQRPPVIVADGVVMIGEARVTKTDIQASNGVIHVIDTVILPEILQSSAILSGSSPAIAWSDR